jgi:hypothetical protein
MRLVASASLAPQSRFERERLAAQMLFELGETAIERHQPSNFRFLEPLFSEDRPGAGDAEFISVWG